MVILSAAVGAVAGIVTTVWKSRKDLEARYDIDLRKRRIEAYADLWKKLEPLAYYSRPQPVTRGSVAELGRALRSWYFRTGGLVLSSSTRPAYFNLQQALEGAGKARADDPATELDDDRVEILKALASRLRTASTGDVATRVGPRLGPSLAARLGPLCRRRTASVRATVDRRWRWKDGSPEPAFFVIVENRTDREVEIVGVEVPNAGEAVSAYGERRFRLQPGEDRELSASVESPGRGPLAPRVTIKMGDGREIRSGSRPRVPLRSQLIAGSNS
jgi:hypothetical protein